jgi:hypothetical protein
MGQQQRRTTLSTYNVCFLASYHYNNNTMTWDNNKDLDRHHHYDDNVITRVGWRRTIYDVMMSYGMFFCIVYYTLLLTKYSVVFLASYNYNDNTTTWDNNKLEDILCRFYAFLSCTMHTTCPQPVLRPTALF